MPRGLTSGWDMRMEWWPPAVRAAAHVAGIAACGTQSSGEGLSEA